MSTVSRVMLSVVLGIGVLASGTALADRPYWAGRGEGHGHDDDRWEHRERHHHDRDDDDRGYGYGYAVYDYARVVDVDPIVTRVVVDRPERECWNEQREVRAPRSATPTVLGAIIGGVVGHQFGHGGSRDVATVAGAVLGGSIGRDASASDGYYETRDVERCNVRGVRDYQDRIEGYRVRYVYHGREYCTTMPYDPGRRVQVRVDSGVQIVY